MAQQLTVKTGFVLEYEGVGGKNGGTYTNSSVKHGATDAQINLAARAVGELQVKNVSRIYKVVGTELSE